MWIRGRYTEATGCLLRYRNDLSGMFCMYTGGLANRPIPLDFWVKTRRDGFGYSLDRHGVLPAECGGAQERGQCPRGIGDRARQKYATQVVGVPCKFKYQCSEGVGDEQPPKVPHPLRRGSKKPRKILPLLAGGHSRRVLAGSSSASCSKQALLLSISAMTRRTSESFVRLRLASIVRLLGFLRMLRLEKRTNRSGRSSGKCRRTRAPRRVRKRVNSSIPTGS